MDEIVSKQLDKILIEGTETLSIEFKREWHWSRKDEDNNTVQWDKFLRNFSGLINTTEDDYIPIKYYIIGYDEKTKKTHDYKFDQEKNPLLFFQKNNLIDIKNNIIKKIKKRFEIVNYREEDFRKEDFEKLLYEKIIITTHEHKNNELLIFIIEPLPFLLSLKNGTLSTIKEKEIPYRKIKNGEPGVYALDRKQEEIVKKLILKEWNKYKLHIPKNSIQVIVEAYNSSFYKKGKIINYNINRAYSSSDFYEIFGLEHREKKEILFIYFSKYTSIKKILEEILETYSEIEEYKDIFLFFESTHNINSQRFKLEEHPKVYEVKKSNIILTKGKKTIECFSPLFNFIDKKIYQDIKIELEQENFFFLGNITGIFIKPSIKETNKSIIHSLNSWVEESLSPIKFVLGEGGIGKTTVVKNFAKSLIESKSSRKDILFINARDLIDKISSVKINNLYSFVKLFIEKEEEVSSDELLNESMFNILLDSGKFLIIIDGLDEAIINSKEFDSIYFIKNIYENCLNNLGKTKVLCTIRTSFWEDKFQTDIGSKIEKLTLEGFNNDLVSDFFEKRLNDPLKAKQAIRKMEKILGKKEKYIPSHLDMIIRIREVSDKLKCPKSPLLNKNIDIDNLIYAICDRECVKFEKKLKTVDEQLNIFIEMSTMHSGECTVKQFKELTGNKYDLYKSHNLLNSIGEDRNKKYELKYDFLKEYFTELFFFKLIKDILDEKESIEKLLEIKNRKLILKLNLSSLSKRAKYILKIEDMEYLFLFLLDVLKSKDKIDIEYRELISFLFSFTLNLLNKSDKENNTDLLKKLFLDENDKKLYYVSFFNSKIKNKKIFNFKELKFYNAYIDYRYFGDSDFDSNTFFEKSEILGKGYTNKCNFKKENFSDDCQLSKEIKEILDEYENKLIDEKDQLIESIKKVLNKLYKNNFIRLTEKKLKKNFDLEKEEILNFLIKENIIKEIYATSKEKRREKFLEIESKYHSLFEEIFEGQTSVNKILQDIVKKFIRLKRG